jgi:hypothetical protein
LLVRVATERVARAGVYVWVIVIAAVAADAVVIIVVVIWLWRLWRQWFGNELAWPLGRACASLTVTSEHSHRVTAFVQVPILAHFYSCTSGTDPGCGFRYLEFRGPHSPPPIYDES